MFPLIWLMNQPSTDELNKIDPFLSLPLNVPGPKAAFPSASRHLCRVEVGVPVREGVREGLRVGEAVSVEEGVRAGGGG